MNPDKVTLWRLSATRAREHEREQIERAEKSEQLGNVDLGLKLRAEAEEYGIVADAYERDLKEAGEDI